MTDDRDPSLERRAFLARAGKAGGSILAAGALSCLLYDSRGTDGSVRHQQAVALPDFRTEHRPGQVMSIVRGSHRAKTLCKAIELLGGMERFVKSGDRVLIRPNAAFASPPMLGATTSPELVSVVVKLCYRAGAKQVRVVDNPINDPASCFALSGIGKAATAAGAELVLPRSTLFKRVTLVGSRLLKNWPVLWEPLQRAEIVLGNQRIASACVMMENMDVLSADVAAVADGSTLSRTEVEALLDYARATRSSYCAGCANVCDSALPEAACISDIMRYLRYLMYYNSYGQRDTARWLFAQIPFEVRNGLLRIDYRLAEARCPQHLPISKLIAEAVEKLA